MMRNNQVFYRPLARLGVLISLVGTISIGCTNLDTSNKQGATEVKSSTKIDAVNKDVRVENNQKVEIEDNDVRVSSKTSTTTNDGIETRSESIDQNTEIDRTDVQSNKITNGRYWIGATDQALEVRGDRYRYDTEGGAQEWQNIAQLKYVKDGVVFDGKNYWCLSTLAPSQITGCGANGWNR